MRSINGLTCYLSDFVECLLHESLSVYLLPHSVMSKLKGHLYTWQDF